MRTLRWIAVAALVLSVTGCASHTGTPHTPATAPTNAQQFDTRADTIAADWRDSALAPSWTSAFIPLQPLLVGPSALRPQSPLAMAVRQGEFTLPARLPGAPTTAGRITYPDGSTMSVPLTGTKAAITAAAPAKSPVGSKPACTAGTKDYGAGCTLTVTGATLGKTSLLTSRGEARVPAWLLHVRQLTQPVAVVAVAPSATRLIGYPGATPGLTGIGPGLNRTVGLTSVDANRIQFVILTGKCETRIEPRVRETATAVVIGGIGHESGSVCTDEGIMTPETITLTRPLGDRPLLDIASGNPVQITPQFTA